VLNCFIFSDYDDLRDVRKKKKDSIVNIDKEKYEVNSLHVNSCYNFICKEIFAVDFRKFNTNLLFTHNSYIICKKKNNLIYSIHFYHFNQNP
jgi:hypothetical protein